MTECLIVVPETGARVHQRFESDEAELVMSLFEEMAEHPSLSAAEISVIESLVTPSEDDVLLLTLIAALENHYGYELYILDSTNHCWQQICSC